MISRGTTRLIAELFALAFRKYRNPSGSGKGYYCSDAEGIYDFLYDNEYPAWLCNAAKKVCSRLSTRPFQEFIMKLHTGESLVKVTSNWSREQREKLGNELLHQIAEDILEHCIEQPTEYRSKTETETVEKCRRSLELDGYTSKGAILLAPETDVLDVKEEAGVLESLYTDLGLSNQDVAIHHLKLSEEHYLAKRWDDSISNSRKFLECVMQEIVATHSQHITGEVLQESIYTRPARVRDYLEKEGLLETKEKETIASVYGLLSQTGGHPYMAENEQARLLRHLALTLSQFVMLRFKGQMESHT